jgi:hypothetical protein
LHRHLVSESRLREGYKNKLGASKQEEDKLNQESSGEDDEGDDQGSIEGEILPTNEGAGHLVDDRFDRQYDEEQKEI